MMATGEAWLERVAWVRQEWPLIGEAMLAALVVETGLRATSHPRLWHWAGVVPRDMASRPDPALLWAILRASYWACLLLPVRGTCLRESLVAARLLSRRGHPVTVQVGVRKAGPRLDSHAWLEDGDGRALTDPLAGYAPLIADTHDRTALPDPAR